jgi:hypothetical protein
MMSAQQNIPRLPLQKQEPLSVGVLEPSLSTSRTHPMCLIMVLLLTGDQREGGTSSLDRAVTMFRVFRHDAANQFLLSVSFVSSET